MCIRDRAGEGFADIIVETDDPDAGIVVELKYTKEYKDMELSLIHISPLISILSCLYPLYTDAYIYSIIFNINLG